MTQAGVATDPGAYNEDYYDTDAADLDLPSSSLPLIGGSHAPSSEQQSLDDDQPTRDGLGLRSGRKRSFSVSFSICIYIY